MTGLRRPALRRVPLALRAGYGLLLLLAPETLTDLGAGPTPAWASPVARLLGGRHLLQAAVLGRYPQLAGPGAMVDLAHASTDLACAAVREDFRTAPLLDAAVEAALAALTAA